MPDWSTWDGGPTVVAMPTVAASAPGTVSSPAALNTKTGAAWVELLSAANNRYGASFATINVGYFSVAGRVSIDLGIGTAGSEVVLVPDLHYAAFTTLIAWYTYVMPLDIPSGVRLAARCQSSAASNAAKIYLTMTASTLKSPSPLGVVTVLGFEAADTSLIIIDAGATANTKPATYTTIGTTPTDRVTRWMNVCMTHNGLGSTANSSFLVDVAVGAAASEQPILSNYHVRFIGATDELIPAVIGFPCNIPPNTRISARCQSSTAVAADRTLDVGAWCLS